MSTQDVIISIPQQEQVSPSKDDSILNKKFKVLDEVEEEQRPRFRISNEDRTLLIKSKEQDIKVYTAKINKLKADIAVLKSSSNGEVGTVKPLVKKIPKVRKSQVDESVITRLVEYIKNIPDQKIAAGISKDPCLNDFYKSNSDVERFKVKEVTSQHSELIIFVDDGAAPGKGWIYTREAYDLLPKTKNVSFDERA